MGTTYDVFKKEGLVVELDEMSNLLNLSFRFEGPGVEISRYGEDGMYIRNPRLTPEDVLAMVEKMTQVALYWVEDPAKTKAEFLAKLEKDLVA